MSEHQSRKSTRFFTTWRSKPYSFMNEEVALKHKRLTASPKPAVVLTELKETLASIYDVNSLDVVPRSKYHPDMLLEPCRKYERGGKMTNFKWSALNEAIRRVERLFVLKHKVTPLRLEEVKFEGSKNSGLPFLARKDEVYPASFDRAKACVNGACPPPVVMFHRGKNTQVARPVFAFPFEWHLVEGMFLYPLQELLLGAKTPYFVGQPSCAISGKLNEISYSPFVVEMDYSGFDGSLSGLLIASGFRVLRKNLILTEEQEKLWDRVASYFVTSPIVAPDGRVYTGRRHGVPSGSMFTQMIDTVCNAIIIEYISIRLNYHHDHYLCVGDDSVIGFQSKPNVEDMASVASELGTVVSVNKTKVHDTDAGDFLIHFLGHNWNTGFPTRPVEDTLERLLAPERLRKEFFSKDKAVRFAAFRERIRAYQEDNASLEAWDVLHSLEKHYVYPELGSGRMKMWPINSERFQNLPIEATGFDRWIGNRQEVREWSGTRAFARVANVFV